MVGMGGGGSCGGGVGVCVWGGGGGGGGWKDSSHICNQGRLVLAKMKSTLFHMFRTDESNFFLSCY